MNKRINNPDANRMERRAGSARIQRTTAPIVSGAALVAAATAIVWIGARTGRAALPPQRPPMVTVETEAAIQKALKYLSTKQSSDGSWRNEGSYGSYPVTMTALSGLALMSSGSTPTQGPYAPNLRKAVNYLVRSSQRNGLICRRGEEESRSLYGHGFSMLFLAETYGMEEDEDRLNQIRWVLQKAVELTGKSQSRLGGWLYTPDMEGDEGSVTVTQVQGLRAARNAGIAVPKDIINKAMQYLEKSALPDGGIAYRVGMTDSRPPITAAAVACWFNAGEYENPLAKKALKYCKSRIGFRGGQDAIWGHFFYTHMYMAQVMYLAGEKDWSEYFPKIRDQLLHTQNEDGSWDGDSVGRVYGTAIGLMILQIPYARLPIMQR